MVEETTPPPPGGGPPARRPTPGPGRRATAPRILAFCAALLGAGAIGAGATALAQRDRPVLVALAPAPIADMKDGSAVAFKGHVAEIFGNKFVVEDQAGTRALVETGRAGEGGRLVAPSEVVIVQGRFARGFVHALAVQHADGRTDMLGPPPPPPPPSGAPSGPPPPAPAG